MTDDDRPGKPPPALWTPPAPAERVGPRRRAAAVAAAVVLACAAGLALFAAASWLARGGGTALPSLTRLRPPDLAPAPATPAPWPTYSAGEPTYLMRMEGLGFGFRAPAAWECIRLDVQPPLAEYACGDAGGEQPGPGGRILERPCEAPCDASVRSRMLASIPYGAAPRSWRRLDETTWYAESRGTFADGRPRYALVMARFWRRGSTGPPDTQLIVQLAGPPDQAATVRKLAAELRAATP